MPEQAADPWKEILREAIQASPDKPLVGTNFRAAVVSAASKWELKFPPANEPELRFIQLLQRYPDVVSVLRRPGQDFLVVSAGRSDLLAKGIQGRLYFIRRDLFEGFTTISVNHPYYDKTADQVVWKTPAERSELTGSLVQIDPATEAAEIQLRREFAEQHPQVQIALPNPMTMQAFSRAVKALGLQREWHGFRTERLSEKIQRWARDNQIEWKDAWLTEGPAYYALKNRMSPSTSETPTPDSDPLQALFSGLDAVDIQRISIPLDLVLKAISSAKKR